MIERLKYWLFQRGKDSGAGADSRTAGSRGGKKERKHGAAVSNLQICGV